MIKNEQLDAMFSGIIGQEYDMLKLICPAAAQMSHLVGTHVSECRNQSHPGNMKIVELGCGTGRTTGAR